MWPLVILVAALAGPAGPGEHGAEAGERVAPATAGATVIAPAAASATVISPATAGAVIGLRQAGWIVTEQRERLEQRPGLPPYETLDRQVHITTFVLERDGRRKRCTLAYDSQLDTFAEDCRDAE